MPRIKTKRIKNFESFVRLFLKIRNIIKGKTTKNKALEEVVQFVNLTNIGLNVNINVVSSAIFSSLENSFANEKTMGTANKL